VVKRTAMGKRLRFFFTMFSTSGGSIVKDLNIENQSLRFILLQYFPHHVILHPTCPTTTRPKNWNHLAHVLETINATEPPHSETCVHGRNTSLASTCYQIWANNHMDRENAATSFRLSPKNTLSPRRRHSQLNLRCTVAPRVKTKANRNKT
jgi:hypothetical protein